MPTFMKASDLACRLLRKANILRGSIWFFRRHFNVNGKGCFSHPQARWIAPCELCSYAKKRRIGVSHFETFRMTSIALNKRYEVFQYVLEMFRKIVCILPILTFLTMKIPQSFLPWGISLLSLSAALSVFFVLICNANHNLIQYVGIAAVSEQDKLIIPQRRITE